MEQAVGGDDGGRGEWWNNPKTVEQLKLSDDQRKAMDSILMEHRKTLIDLKAALEKAELGMQPLLSADQPNETQVLAQIDKVAQARAELEKANARFLLGLRSKITLAQWKQLQDLHSNSGVAAHQWRGQGNRENQRPEGQPQPGAQQRPGTQPPSSTQPSGQPSGPPSEEPGAQPSGPPSGEPGGQAPAGTAEQQQ